MALPCPEDYWQSCIILIDCYCLWISEGQDKQMPSEPRDAVAIGTCGCWRATKNEKINQTLSPDSRSWACLRCHGQFCSSKIETLIFYFIVSLSLLSELPCVYLSWSQLPWKHSFETVCEVVGAQKTRVLFIQF